MIKDIIRIILFLIFAFLALVIISAVKGGSQLGIFDYVIAGAIGGGLSEAVIIVLEMMWTKFIKRK